MKQYLSRVICAGMAVTLCACSSSTAATSSTTAAAASYTAGTYTATTTAYKGDLTVSVTFDDTSIKDVQVTDQKETYGIGQGMDTTPVSVIPQEIVDAQGLGVDLVTGATYTSAAIVTAVSDCVKQAGGDVDALKNVSSAKAEAKDETYDTDVVIAGAGGAGLSAAIEAAKAGSKVIIIEKQGIIGGATTRSGGKVMAAGTDLQIADGITDTADDMYDYLASVGGDYINTSKLRTFCDNALDTYDWLEQDVGVVMQDVEPIHSSITPNRVTNTTGGGGMTNGYGGNITVPLYNMIKDNENVTIIYNTTVNSVIMDNDAAAGVEATAADGSKITVNAKSVIIATGGYASNKDKVENYGEKFDNYITSVPAGNIGEGMDMAEAVGAQIEDYPAVQVVYTSLTSGVGINEEAGLIISDGGERVANEYTYQYHVGDALAKVHSNKAWYIATASDTNQMVQYAMTLDSTPKASTVSELAEQIDIDADTLQATIDRYNELAAAGNDEDFGKPAEYMTPIEGDTIYAIELDPCVTVTYSGIVTDTNSAVLNTSNEPITGLYAAGEVSFPGLFGTEYPGCGVAISGSIYYGRVAGQQAAASAQAN